MFPIFLSFFNPPGIEAATAAQFAGFIRIAAIIFVGLILLACVLLLYKVIRNLICSKNRHLDVVDITPEKKSDPATRIKVEPELIEQAMAGSISFLKIDPHICPICGRPGSYAQDTPGTGRGYCSICGCHWERIVCPTCKDSFDTRDRATVHMDKGIGRYMCPHCDREEHPRAQRAQSVPAALDICPHCGSTGKEHGTRIGNRHFVCTTCRAQWWLIACSKSRTHPIIDTRDPRVKFDKYTGRWICPACAEETATAENLSAIPLLGEETREIPRPTDHPITTPEPHAPPPPPPGKTLATPEITRREIPDSYSPDAVSYRPENK